MRPAPLSTVELVGASALGAWAARRGWGRPAAGPFVAEPHLTAAIDWLVRSQDAASDDGASAAYALLHGWLPGEPETAGYLVPTLYDAGHALDCPDLKACAERMGLRVLASGRPSAQSVFALLRTWKETGDPKFSAGAIIAGDWLVDHAAAAAPTAHRARLAWALLLLAKATAEFKFYEAAKALLDGVVAAQNPRGWFADNAVEPGQLPTTDAVATVARCLIEAYTHTGDDACWRAGELATDRLLDKLARKGFIAGRHDASFEDAARSECVAGDAQAAIAALRMFQLRGERRHFDRGLAAIAHVQGIVRVSHRNPGVRGAIPGAWPVFGRSAPLRFPAVATKYWADALMFADALSRKRDGKPLGSAALILQERYFG